MGRSTDPRYLAVDTLNKLESSGEFLKDLLDAQLQKSSLSRLDQGLFTELVMGTVRMKRSLDYVLAQFSKRPWLRFTRPCSMCCASAFTSSYTWIGSLLPRR